MQSFYMHSIRSYTYIYTVMYIASPLCMYMKHEHEHGFVMSGMFLGSSYSSVPLWTSRVLLGMKGCSESLVRSPWRWWGQSATLYYGEQKAVISLYGSSNFHVSVSVLKTFIHDPLVEWGKVKGRPTSAEATNEKVHTRKYMFTKLQGQG